MQHTSGCNVARRPTVYFVGVTFFPRQQSSTSLGCWCLLRKVQFLLFSSLYLFLWVILGRTLNSDWLSWSPWAALSTRPPALLQLLMMRIIRVGGVEGATFQWHFSLSSSIAPSVFLSLFPCLTPSISLTLILVLSPAGRLRPAPSSRKRVTA